MEKLDKVIAGLECCTERRCTSCPYLEQEMYCMTVLEKDALELLREQNRLIRELSDHIPCCDNCEGKTVFGERTDKCVYEIEGFDNVLYCAKRGIENCFGYRKKIDGLTEDLTGAHDEIHALLKKQDILRAELAEERERSARWLRESEPVVHAHWEPMEEPGLYKCSGCGFPDTQPEFRKRCSNCGAHMDEEVAHE